MTVQSLFLPTSDRWDYRFAVSDAERTELTSVAQQLARMAPRLLDAPAWLEEARQLSCRLPVRLLTALRRYRHDSGLHGTLFVANLPVDEGSLADTPAVPESVERAATVPAALSMLLGLQLGELVAYRDEKAGALVQNVVPVRGREGSQSNAGSVPLGLHVENAFHTHRPDYVGLMCLRNDHAKKAGTLVSSIRRALPLLSEEDRKVLYDSRFVTAPPPSFQSGANALPQGILGGSLSDPNICVDFNATVALDEEAGQVLDRLHGALAETSSSIVLQSGEMAFLDNRIVLHGRTHFTPRYDGRDRWLHRIYVHLDNRRSNEFRVDGGSVLS